MNDPRHCSSCDYFDYDEYWNGAEEVDMFICKAGHNNHIGWNTEPCEDFNMSEE